MTEDFMAEERQRNLWDRQRSLGRNCFFLAMGFFVIAGIIIYNWLK